MNQTNKTVNSPREIIDCFLQSKCSGRGSTGFILSWKTLIRVHPRFLYCELWCLSNLHNWISCKAFQWTQTSRKILKLAYSSGCKNLVSRKKTVLTSWIKHSSDSLALKLATHRQPSVQLLQWINPNSPRQLCLNSLMLCTIPKPLLLEHLTSPKQCIYMLVGCLTTISLREISLFEINWTRIYFVSVYKIRRK